MENSDIIFASQNASMVVTMLSFLIFGVLWLTEVHSRNFNIVFWVCFSMSLLLGGYLLHRGIYTIPRIERIMGNEENLNDARNNIGLAWAANLMSIGLITLNGILTKDRFGNKLWLILFFGGMSGLFASLLFAYYY